MNLSLRQWPNSLLVLAFLSISFLNCMGEEPTYECTSDNECSIGQFCENNSCLCKTNDACGDAQYCNNWGVCQPRPPCLGNKDCPSGEICDSSDSSGGRCLPASQCGSSVHCELNQYCDPTTQTCQPGCRNAGDCQLGHICLNGACVDGNTGNNCTQCPTRPEPDASYCDFGEVCNANGQCVAHTRQQSLCQSCSSSDFFSQCPSNMLCLLDDARQDNQYCTPFCNTEQDCPNGYNNCYGIQYISNGGQCSTDNECPSGSKCLGKQESVLGSCSCLTDNDCPQTLALCGGGTCANLGNPCTSNNDCIVECTMAEHPTLGLVGTCQTKAKACGKGDGVTCEELQTTQADCHNY